MASKKPNPTLSPKPKSSAEDGGGLDCDIAIDCDLSGVHPEVLVTVNKGDRLGVRIEPGQPYRSVVCITGTGAVVGAISALPGHGRLLACLDRGVIYEVAVQDVGSGRCHVIGGAVS